MRIIVDKKRELPEKGADACYFVKACDWDLDCDECDRLYNTGRSIMTEEDLEKWRKEQSDDNLRIHEEASKAKARCDIPS